ncbi:MAG: hypothetical protein JST00_21515 [Deltaproteobacteria bacterium]|nr:hypothetical protein [Deltaproteobacteria bacterium]
MPTLRDHVKKTLSTSEPDDREAAQAFGSLLSRARAESARRGPTRWLLVPAFAAACAVLYLFVFRHDGSPSNGRTFSKTPPLPDHGLHLYLRAAGEPDALALRLDLDNAGEP